MDKLHRFRRYSKRMISRLTKRETEDITEDIAEWIFTTRISEEDLTISWCIENINQCPLKAGEYHESPPFYTGFTNEVKWVIRMFPKGRKIAERVGIFIHKISENPKTYVKYLLEVKLMPESCEGLKEKDEIYSCKNPDEATGTVCKKGALKEWGTDEFIPTTQLFGKKSLWIICYLSVVYLDDGNTENYTAGPSTSLSLYDDLKEMYKSGRFSDVTLQVGKKHFAAHKAILAARSKVFAAMFDHETSETLTNIVIIDDVEPSVMNSVLQYIYTGRVEDLTMEKAVRMFCVADKYSLVELQHRCVGVMLAKLSVENVCQIAKLAHMHSVSKLKMATNYLFRKYKHDILQKNEWKEIIRDNPQLASDILQAVSYDFNTIL